MKKKEYTHNDAVKEFINTPKLRKKYKKECQQLRISYQVIELRERHKMTQKELANKLHTTQQFVSRIEKDSYKPSFRTLEKIAQVFGGYLEVRIVG